MTIIKVEYDTEDPLCSIVNNIRKGAKKEVFDDIDKDRKYFYHLLMNISDMNKVDEIIENIKKRHLSTFVATKAT